jgi:chromosome segregation ATPase
MPSAEMGVFALLALISDPKAAEDRLAAIKEAHDQATLAYSQLQTEMAAFNQAKAESDKAAAAQTADLEKREAALANSNADLANRSKVVADREVMDREINAKLTERIADLDQREQLISKRESEALAKDTKLSDWQHKLDVAEADYQARLARLKELTG